MSANSTVAFYTFGCKLNYSETSAIGRQFTDAGYQKVDFQEDADVYVINTCSVTEHADKKCRHLVSKTRRQTPEAKIVVIGCYAQLQPEEIAKFEGVDLVLGAKEKFNILQYINELPERNEGLAEIHSCAIEEVDFYNSAFSYGDRTRTFLKVQDGCDYSCTFCTIPLARGRSRSPKIEEVIKQAEEIATTDVKEIVLTGVNIGDFGKGRQGAKRSEEQFIDLVKALDEVEGIERFRISSIEPNLLNNDIIEFVAQSKRFMPHFHIPLQSGSNNMLAQMRRRYKRELYVDRVAKIKEVMPHCCIGVDVIVGFPGETDEEFMETYNFINELDISYLHVFTYSERPNTPANEMDGVVPVNVRKKRNKMLRILSEKKRLAFYRDHLGETREVLFEGSVDESGMMHGFTDNYVKVKRPFHAPAINSIEACTLQAVDDDGQVVLKEYCNFRPVTNQQ